jgi:hypothetical protein
MVRRLLIGLVVGLVIGGAVAAGLVAGLGVQTFTSDGGTLIAYLAAALTGAVTGLIAGKPIWSSGGKIEAGLKSFFGALLGVGLMFALHRWASSWAIDLPAIGAVGRTPVGDLPAASLPLIAAVLGGLFELDNTDAGEKAEKAEKKGAAGPGERRRVADGAPRARVAGSIAKGPREADDDDADVGSKRMKR